MLRQSSYIFVIVLMVISSALLHLLCLVLYALLQQYFYCVQFSSASLHLFICLASLHNFYFIFYLFFCQLALLHYPFHVFQFSTFHFGTEYFCFALFLLLSLFLMKNLLTRLESLNKLFDESSVHCTSHLTLKKNTLIC